MCGRYALSKLPAELIEEFEIHTGKQFRRFQQIGILHLQKRFTLFVKIPLMNASSQ
jgi:putative SOS response-associated peptidase YedK